MPNPKCPTNDVLFRRQNATAQSFTTTKDNPRNARPQNNKGNGIGSHFNTTIQASDNPHAVERRNIERMRIPMPECRKCVEPIVATPDPAMLRRARITRIARDGPNSSDTPADVLESGWKSKEWSTVVKERYA